MPARPVARARAAARVHRTPPRSRGRGPSRTFAVFSGVVTNAGNAETAPVVEVTGPTPATWFVANVTQGRTLRVNYAVPAGQLLSIDLATRRVTLAGVAISGAVDRASTRWWTLSPGANTVQASVAATVRHHDAYR